MGPRLVSRGEAEVSGVMGAVEEASMGPRLVSRGERLVAARTDGYPQLQGATAC